MTELIDACSPNVIVHLAADTTGRRRVADVAAGNNALDVNLLGTVRLSNALAASGWPYLLLRLGGLEEYGNGPVPYRESQREAPVSPYSASQVAVTHWLQMQQPVLPFRAITLRSALAYGPRQSDAFLIPALMRAMSEKRHFTVRNASAVRDLIFIDDLIDAICRAIDVPLAGGALLNVASGIGLTMGDVATRIAQLFPGHQPPELRDEASGPNEIRVLVGDTSLAASALGWTARVDIAAGLERTLSAFRSECA